MIMRYFGVSGMKNKKETKKTCGKMDTLRSCESEYPRTTFMPSTIPSKHIKPYPISHIKLKAPRISRGEHS